MAVIHPLVAREASPDHHVDRSMQTWNKATQSLCIIFMTVFFGLRVYTRTSLLRNWGQEDWCCLGAWALGVAYSAIALAMGHFGGGVHWDDVPEAHHIPFQKLTYVTMVMYGPTAFLTKMTLLWIMTRVFSPFKKSVIFIYVFLALMLLYYIPAVIVKIRICMPIAKFWEQDLPGSCLDQSAIIMADAVVSVVSDLIVLILPLPLTMRLQLPHKKKMRVMGMLGAGGLACASSVIRLVLIQLTGNSKDATIAFMRVNMFGNAEIAIGVICACLPALSALITQKYNEYSSGRYNSHNSEYQLSKVRNQTKSSRADRSNNLSVNGHDSDKDILMTNVQAVPRVETTVQGDFNRSGQNQQGIMRTVDVSTSVASRDS
ncbi:hypothetical protein ASPVEDRAFT_41515 [Aspergillus versicolor CBS 583.65]|uniref:Rhodopsin domain-containing protein n=1 Tax=Aspergillus versicolor CBS 583.65 TaxID=1036611 RepID=A0A1L9PKC3_ASPVE|nr:uncharacterized protein ASPVEDRAFT_41515 [Aspergillus versicolor CBS 583.65]OJJ01988.1 hypothetical protein ASPVEDRAFT_41515 [Aspergillus versicolor CBS 583.65]